MRAQSAAAPVATGAHGKIDGNATTIPLPWAALPPVIAQRLRAAGIATCEQWLALGAKRRLIWGVTRRASKQVDSAVSALLTQGWP
jgi:hypothetical protein